MSKTGPTEIEVGTTCGANWNVIKSYNPNTHTTVRHTDYNFYISN